MSDFPEILNRFITEKNIHVYSMVKYCDIDRSTMYKIIKGTRRSPSEEIRDKIAAFMRLSPAETQQFEHAWQISVTGKVNYYRRKNAESFLLNFPAFSDIPGEFPGSARKPFSSKKECISFSDPNEFSAFFKYIIEQEKISGDGQIGLLMQPSFIPLLRSLIQPGLLDTSIHIDHIFCMENAEQLTETNDYRSLCYLGNLLPLFVNQRNYHPWCFYDDIQSHFCSLNLFPVLILTKKAVITCTSDCTEGILYQSPEVISMLWNIFDTYRSLCHPLFQVPDQDSICRIRSSSSPAFSGWSFKENGVHCYCSKNTVKKYISDLRLHASDNNLLNFSAQHFHFLKSPLAEASENIQIYAEDKNMFLHFKNTSGGSVYLDLQEPRLASALLDYIKNIEKDFLYTEEENIRYVKEINQKI